MWMLLVLAGILMLLWLVGLGGGWAANSAWLLFVVAVAIFLLFLFVMAFRGRRRPLP